MLYKSPHAAGHFVRHRAGDDHQVGLPRRGAKRAGAEAVHVVTARPGGHHLDRTAGQSERHRPDARLPGPIDRLLDGRRDDVFLKPSFNPRLRHSGSIVL
jgi:hypothetical protein